MKTSKLGLQKKSIMEALGLDFWEMSVSRAWWRFWVVKAGKFEGECSDVVVRGGGGRRRDGGELVEVDGRSGGGDAADVRGGGGAGIEWCGVNEDYDGEGRVVG